MKIKLWMMMLIPLSFIAGCKVVESVIEGISGAVGGSPGEVGTTIATGVATGGTSFLIQLGIGALTGLGTGLLGWAKNKEANGQAPKLDYKKVGADILWGASAGVVTNLMGVPLETTTDIGKNVGAVVMTDWGTKALWRHLLVYGFEFVKKMITKPNS